MAERSSLHSDEAGRAWLSKAIGSLPDLVDLGSADRGSVEQARLERSLLLRDLPLEVRCGRLDSLLHSLVVDLSFASLVREFLLSLSFGS